MRSLIDFSSLPGLLSTLAGLVLVSLVAVGIRLLFMHVVQRRRERENRQINERLRVLIAAYKTLGGAFTGDLRVDPAHLRDQRRRPVDMPTPGSAATGAVDDTALAAVDTSAPGSERRRRVRDAVEAALSDVVLLGTDEQVRLAAQAATDMAAGRRVETAALVVSLRAFIREVLELGPVPAGLAIPNQGPLRTGGSSGGGRPAPGERARTGRGGGGGGGGGGGSAGAGTAIGIGRPFGHEDDAPGH